MIEYLMNLLENIAGMFQLIDIAVALVSFWLGFTIAAMLLFMRPELFFDTERLDGLRVKTREGRKIRR